MTKSLAVLNDTFRFLLKYPSLSKGWGKYYMTGGVAILPETERRVILDRVAGYSEFTSQNDPHGEHDFGEFWLYKKHFYWKIDYYAKFEDGTVDYEHGSEDPYDEKVTSRVLTVMLSSEY